MKVGIIGSGGREHAICQSIKNSSKISEIYCFPGNAGTENIANNVLLDLDNFEEIKDYILKRKTKFWTFSCSLTFTLFFRLE